MDKLDQCLDILLKRSQTVPLPAISDTVEHDRLWFSLRLWLLIEVCLLRGLSGVTARVQAGAQSPPRGREEQTGGQTTPGWREATQLNNPDVGNPRPLSELTVLTKICQRFVQRARLTDISAVKYNWNVVCGLQTEDREARQLYKKLS